MANIINNSLVGQTVGYFTNYVKLTGWRRAALYIGIAAAGAYYLHQTYFSNPLKSILRLPASNGAPSNALKKRVQFTSDTNFEPSTRRLRRSGSTAGGLPSGYSVNHPTKGHCTVILERIENQAVTIRFQSSEDDDEKEREIQPTDSLIVRQREFQGWGPKKIW